MTKTKQKMNEKGEQARRYPVTNSRRIPAVAGATYLATERKRVPEVRGGHVGGDNRERLPSDSLKT